MRKLLPVCAVVVILASPTAFAQHIVTPPIIVHPIGPTPAPGPVVPPHEPSPPITCCRPIPVDPHPVEPINPGGPNKPVSSTNGTVSGSATSNSGGNATSNSNGSASYNTSVSSGY